MRTTGIAIAVVTAILALGAGGVADAKNMGHRGHGSVHTGAIHGKSAFAPGHVKKRHHVRSARFFAPGHVKKRHHARSARAFAPGHR
jgi:hypothetical protein